MQVSTHSKTTQNSSSTSSNKQTFNLDHSFEENLIKNQEAVLSVGNNTHIKTIKVQEERCLEVTRNIKRKEKMCAKVEKYLVKKMEEERRRIKIMIQVLNDISKIFPYMLFHSNLKNKI